MDPKTIWRGRSLEVDCIMAPVPPAIISAAFSEMGSIGNAFVWSRFSQSPTPKVFVNQVRLGASTGRDRPRRCLAPGVWVMTVVTVGGSIIAAEATVALIAHVFPSGNRGMEKRWPRGQVRS